MTEAEVRLQLLPAAQARKQMESPLEMRKGEIKGMTLTIPLLSGPNSYLVVKIPGQAVNELTEQVKTVPEDKRAAFIRQWVMSNQQAALEKYVRDGRTEKRFMYDIVPMRSSLPPGTSITKKIPPPAPVAAPVYKPPAPEVVTTRTTKAPPPPPPAPVQKPASADKDLIARMMQDVGTERRVLNLTPREATPERGVQQIPKVQIDISEGSRKTAKYNNDPSIHTINGGPLRLSVTLIYKPVANEAQAIEAGNEFAAKLKPAIAAEAKKQELTVPSDFLDKVTQSIKTDFIRQAMKGKR